LGCSTPFGNLAAGNPETTRLFVYSFDCILYSQDALLPHVESGLLTLIGATTENPSFALSRALMSRCRVLVLEKLEPLHVRAVIERALVRDSSLK